MCTRKCGLHYGPIFSYLLQVFKIVERFVDFKGIWCKSSTIWNNRNLITGGKPFTNRNWKDKGINTLQDILDFQDLCSQYGVDKHSLYFYFRLRTAGKAFKVPSGSDLRDHPVLSWFHRAPRRLVSWLVSCVYDTLNSQNYTPSPGMMALEREAAGLNHDLDWSVIWNNVSGASKNPNHQYIHMKFCHRAYVTPRIRHQMGLTPDQYCSFCNQGTLGSFLYIMW